MLSNTKYDSVVLTCCVQVFLLVMRLTILKEASHLYTVLQSPKTVPIGDEFKWLLKEACGWTYFWELIFLSKICPPHTQSVCSDSAMPCFSCKISLVPPSSLSVAVQKSKSLVNNPTCHGVIKKWAQFYFLELKANVSHVVQPTTHSMFLCV